MVVSTTRPTQQLLGLRKASVLMREIRNLGHQALRLTDLSQLDTRSFSMLGIRRRTVCVSSPRLLELNAVVGLVESGAKMICFRSGTPDLLFEKLGMVGGVELKWLDGKVGLSEIEYLIECTNAIPGIEVLVVVSRTPLSRGAYRLLKMWGEVASVETDVAFLEKSLLEGWERDGWS